MSRETSPLETAVLSVTRLGSYGGATASFNVIPDSATFGATLRSLSDEHLTYLKQRVEEVRWPLLWYTGHCLIP